MASTRNSSPSADLLTRVADCLGQYVRRGERLTVALSGGADSVFLLHALHKLSVSHGLQLSALHVNHGISPNAAHWQSFCERLCAAWNIRLDVSRVAVAPRKDGLEAAARRARYDVFADVSAEWLALAHQRDDQAETLMLNLLRGTGLGGAAAMPRARAVPGRPGLRILRPLLEVSRKEIEACAHQEGLTWIEDESNADTHYSRNFIRHRVLPLLRDRFPGCEAVLARAAAHFADCQNLLQELAREDSNKAVREGRIVAAQLKIMNDARARNLMRYVLQRESVTLPDTVRLYEIVRQVCHAAPDSHLSFDLGEKVLHRYRGEVWLVPHFDAVMEKEWLGEDEMAWGGGKLRFLPTMGEGISREKLASNKVKITARQGGERFHPEYGRPRRELKKLLQEHAVPPWERGRLPLLWCGDELVWVPGIGIDIAWKCTSNEPGISPEYQPKSF